ncbi:MAG: ribosomal protection-like ABC-F family protein [Chitinophagales bacterium]
MSLLISCRGITKRFGDLTVLNRVDLDIHPNDRIGLIGANGAGKTTLASIIAEEIEPDEGSVSYANKPAIGYLVQQSEVSGIMENPSGDSRFGELASKLGIGELNNRENLKSHDLSGGEKTKLSLADVWSRQTALLILDEPTNHLDSQSVEWLIEQINSYKGAVIVISHDRHFLDRTVNRIAEIEKGRIETYSGNYSFYRDEKARKREAQLHMFLAQQKEQEQIEDAIEQLRRWATKAHNQAAAKARETGIKMGGKEFYRAKAKKRDQAVKSQIKRLEKKRSEGVNRPDREPNAAFQIQQDLKRGRRLLEVDNISKSYGTKSLFEASSFYMNRGDKVGIFGPNGCGKTTLIRVLMGQEPLDGGDVFVSSSARIAYIDQSLGEAPEITPWDHILNYDLAERSRVATLLVQLGIRFERLRQPSSRLSPGERMKIKTALAILEKNNVLILDEPTNHLDIYSRESLEQCLVDYEGSILLVSHDKYLMQRVCDRLLVFRDRKIEIFEGRLEEYLLVKSQKSGLTGNGVMESVREELLQLENQIAFTLGRLGQYKPEQPEYLKLDAEFRGLIARREHLRSQ